MLKYTYSDFITDLPLLANQCQAFAPQLILPIARGGLTLGHALAMALNVRDIQSIQVSSYDDTIQRETLNIKGFQNLQLPSRVLLVDDIVDTGATLHHLLPLLREHYPKTDFRTAALFTKQSAKVQPDFSLHEAHEWIEFFWERDFLNLGAL